MKANLVVIAIAAACAVASLLRAEPPAERKSGKVLILPNQRTLEGDIERVGDRYRIRRAHGELWLPIEKALYLGADWDDAYSFMAAQANLLDPDERIRIARWCQANALYDLAAKELAIALQIRPRDPAAQQLKNLVEQQLRSAGRRPDPAVQTVGFEAPASLDVGVKSLAMFSARVQPILMNACVRCHVAEKNIPFRLFRVTDTNFRSAMQNNLVSALAQIDTDTPDLSPLLNKAVSVHGNASQAPLNGRDGVPFQTLQLWVRQVIEHNPHLRAQRHPPAQARQVPHHEAIPAAPKTTAAFEPPPAARPPSALPSLPVAPLAQNAAAQTPPSTSPAGSQPRALTAPSSVGPADPYDPHVFNQLMHPRTEPMGVE